MATVELKPGDNLNIYWTSVQQTPLGSKEIESNFSFTYDELLQSLRSKGKSRKSKTHGSRFSRVVSLSSNALISGNWATGAAIDRSEVFQNLMSQFKKLNDDDYADISRKARNNLGRLLAQAGKVLKPKQKSELEVLMQRVQATQPAGE